MRRFGRLTKPVMQLPGNPLGYGAFMRALLVALFEWVEHGTAPPDSRFPSRAAGTLVPLAEARATFPRLPEVNFPNVLNELRLRDHSVEPPIESTAYPVFVQSTDADGNALGGIRHPLLDGTSGHACRLVAARERLWRGRPVHHPGFDDPVRRRPKPSGSVPAIRDHRLRHATHRAMPGPRSLLPSLGVSSRIGC